MSSGLQMLGSFSVLRSRALLTPPSAAAARRLVFFSCSAATSGDGGALQVRALQDRPQGGLPRHAPLLRHGQPPPSPPGRAILQLSTIPFIEVGTRLEQYHKASSLTFAVQDGPQAGQTVPHVHIHVIPRRTGDFEKNDEIYDAIDAKQKELKEKLDLDLERKDRTMEEMAHEANEYRALFS
ncbi:hypothetical protein QOZ80_5AG0379430 [Eleusine coracana subsp. coracana]|nr:hypothetical protein QOZ80_5AG0379430 [Eleusine coracana subsp. coracana]